MASGWRAVLPPSQWLPEYRPRWLAADALAGVTLAAYAIPVALAYATLAGLPPERGVYGYLLGGLLYALFGTSRQLAVGPTSAISMLVGATVAGLSGGDPARAAEVAALTAFTVATLAVVAWLFKLSTLVSFISETILLGFKAGAALVIALTQLPKLLGVKGGGEHFFERLAALAGQVGETHVATLAFGLAVVALLLAGERLLPGRPVALGVVALALAAVAFTPLGEIGLKTVGALPAGLPEIGRPAARLRDVDGVLPLAAACLLLAYIESVSAARALAGRHGYEVDPRQELLGLGAANLAAAFGQSYPIAGGLSQSAVNDKAGAKTPLALVFASLAIGLCLVFLTGVLRDLPSVVLAALVLVAVKGLIDVPELRRLWRTSRFEFSIAAVAFAGVLLQGILRGVLLAAVVSILLLLRRTMSPHVAFLGRIPGTRRYSDLERNPDNEDVPGILIFRVEMSWLYFNVQSVHAQVRQRIRGMDAPPRCVICDLSTSPHVDVAGVRLLATLERELRAAGIELKLVEAHASVRDLLRAEGLDERVGPIDRRESLDDAVRAAGG